MKVLHLVPYYPPERMGGVGEFVAHLHAALREAGHTSTVVTAGNNSEEDIHRIARTPLGWFLKTALWVRRAAAYDIVHAQSGEALPAIVLLACWPRKCKILLTFHLSWRGIGASFGPYRIGGEWVRGGAKEWLYRWVVTPLHALHDSLAIRCADQCNAVTYAAARDVFGPARAEEIPVVYYGLEPATSEGEIAPPVEMLYCGAPGPRKRVMTLPPLLESVRERVPGARLRIAGFRLEDVPALRAAFERIGLLEAVDNPGRLTSAELAPHYRSAKLLVLPSAYEGLPLVLLEAMHHGLPAVATHVSGHPEAIEHGENGLLAPLDDVESMADCIASLLQDEPRQLRMGQRSFETARKRFTRDRMCEDYLALYDSMLRGALK